MGYELSVLLVVDHTLSQVIMLEGLAKCHHVLPIDESCEDGLIENFNSFIDLQSCQSFVFLRLKLIWDDPNCVNSRI